MADPLPSKSKINNCGELLRQAWHCGVVVPEAELDAAVAVVKQYRAAHSSPLARVRYGVRSMVRTEGAQETISQRLKRVPRIARKLDRMAKSPSGRSPLARLEDIGGVRAVLKDGPELDRVRARIEKNWAKDFKREARDYIAYPKDIGYRAVHFVVVRDGRAIEVQLRTRGQQEWAEAVEAADARHGLNLKDGVGPSEMVEYFEVAGEVIYRREYHLDIPSGTLARFSAAREAVIEAGYYRA